jgi:hypothetical protein
VTPTNEVRVIALWNAGTETAEIGLLRALVVRHITRGQAAGHSLAAARAAVLPALRAIFIAGLSWQEGARLPES